MTKISVEEFEEKYKTKVGRKPKYNDLADEIATEVKQELTEENQLPKGLMIVSEVDLKQSQAGSLRQLLINKLPKSLKVVASKLDDERTLIQIKNKKGE